VATEVIMPKVDMVMETGTFLGWLKKEGDRVNKGEPLFVIEPTRPALSLNRPGMASWLESGAKPNDVIPVTEVIGYLLAAGESLPAQAGPPPASAGPRRQAPRRRLRWRRPPSTRG